VLRNGRMIHRFPDMCTFSVDHAIIVPYDEGDLAQPQIPMRTLYNRWTIEIEFLKRRNTVYVNGVNIRVCDSMSTSVCDKPDLRCRILK
jgi:hypothetical protein